MEQSTTEQWKHIPGWEDRYEVSDQGRVRSLPTTFVNQFGAVGTRHGKIRAQYVDKRGYRHVSLYRGNKGKRYGVHQLVMLAFVGPRPNRSMVCHNDSNPGNNMLSNLRYDTNSGNQLDRVANGTSARGTANSHNVHSPDAIREIRRLYASGALSQREIGEMYGVRQAAISAIVTGKSWAWFEPENIPREPPSVPALWALA